jgi:hypothetical protein
MSLPNLGDTGRGNNKKKTIGGVDASMITRMKREQAIVSELRTEPTVRTGVSFAITAGPSSGATNNLTYTFPLQTSPPFVVGEGVTVSGNTGALAVASLASATDTISYVASTATVSAATTITTLNGVVNAVITISAAFSNSAVIAVGSVVTVTAGTLGYFGLANGTHYYINAIDATGLILTAQPYTMATGARTAFTLGGAVTGTATLSVNIVTHTFGTNSPNLFAVGDSVTVSGIGADNASGLNGTFRLTTVNGTTGALSYQALGVVGTGVGTAAVFTPLSSRYNGTFGIIACTANTVTVTTSYYGIFNTNLTTGTISGTLPFGSVYQQIRDGMKTRGFTDGPIMPFYARGGSLGFYRVL